MECCTLSTLATPLQKSWKLLKRARTQENLFKVKLGINKSDKKHSLLENQKSSIQYSMRN